MNTQELFEHISKLYEAAKENHEGKSKASKARARKSLSELKKLISLYNKTSIAESKA